jgi:hypothetical protein
MSYKIHTHSTNPDEALEEHKTPTGSHAFEYGDWHPTCKNVQVFHSSASGRGLVVYCPDCRCVADLEAVSGRITFESSKEARGG